MLPRAPPSLDLGMGIPDAARRWLAEQRARATDWLDSRANPQLTAVDHCCRTPPG